MSLCVAVCACSELSRACSCTAATMTACAATPLALPLLQRPFPPTAHSAAAALLFLSRFPLRSLPVMAGRCNSPTLGLVLFFAVPPCLSLPHASLTGSNSQRASVHAVLNRQPEHHTTGAGAVRLRRGRRRRLEHGSRPLPVDAGGMTRMPVAS